MYTEMQILSLKGKLMIFVPFDFKHQQNYVCYRLWGQTDEFIYEFGLLDVCVGLITIG